MARMRETKETIVTRKGLKQVEATRTTTTIKDGKTWTRRQKDEVVIKEIKFN